MKDIQICVGPFRISMSAQAPEDPGEGRSTSEKYRVLCRIIDTAGYWYGLDLKDSQVRALSTILLDAMQRNPVAFAEIIGVSGLIGREE